MPEETTVGYFQDGVMTIDQALAEVKSWAGNPHQSSAYSNSALAYANAMAMAKLEAVQMGLTADKGEHSQLLYVLSNLQYWRGDVAKRAKAAIKARIKELS